MLELSVNQAYHAPNYTVDLTPFLEMPTKECLEQVGCQPIFINIPKKTIDEIYSLSDSCFIHHFDKLCELAKRWELEFASSEEGIPWMNVRFGIRDKRPAIERKKDQKFYLQFCREFGEWVMKYHSDELRSIPPLELLFNRLLEIEKSCQKIFLEKLQQLAAQYPETEKLFYTYNCERRVPISMRVISYEYEGDYSVSPHYDKAAMTILLPSDDAREEECLIIAPADGTGFDPDKLRRPLRPISHDTDVESTGLFITGSMLEYIGIPIAPTPHAVLPHRRNLRHVLVAFCNVPYLDTKHLRYDLLYKKEMPTGFLEKFEKNFPVKTEDGLSVSYRIRE